ncbi:Wobble nucleotide-excising tRNase [Duganella sacchari]|uniref:Wobble nucleotide-excising tRNase n=1 Tax=Duganella sacchari TaxID=551987 RepID=A0A1M7R5U9_9BURK|nr:AAA family ATPase [Duganella sacchari]SHN40555.1 Wobble nucleotide-excising tRNase [Duganella sacchari]
MLKNIQRIKGLGVFNDYSHKADETAEFGAKNLIYGWNYSGKTTLSRLVSMLEKKALPTDLTAFNFVLNTDGDAINDTNYTAHPFAVRVFNSDFISENLNFAGSSFKPILLLGADSEKAQKEIDELEKDERKLREEADLKSKEAAASVKSMNAAKTTTASTIKTTMGIVEAFSATHLDKQIGLVRIDLPAFKLEADVVQEKLKIARAQEVEKLPPLQHASISLKLDGVLTEVPALLNKIPDMANTIEHLAQHPKVEAWIATGLPLHEGKEACEFCGSPLKQDHMATLLAHFSKDLANHKQDLTNLKIKLSGAEISYIAPKDAEVEPACRIKIAEAAAKLILAIKHYNEASVTAILDLDRKSQAPFSIVSQTPIKPGLTQAVKDALKELNDLIDGNNKSFDNFPTEKADAVNALKLHFAQEFCVNQKLGEFDETQKKLADRVKECTDSAAKLTATIQEKKAIISKSQLGREEMNKLIHELLGVNSVHIDVVPVGTEERFQLQRANKKPAKHLSEGEKTAIAFSYFLTRLREHKNFEELIVYIDDPISSLDSNHIFQVTAIIKDTFFHQKPGGEWGTRCKQLFVSTHNFEFFNLLKELKPDNKASRHYLVKRNSPTTSIFCDLPKSLSQYSSEYHFLFSVLHEFQQSADKKDFRVLMMLPNAARRFLELYSYAKYPDTKNATVDQRVDKIFGEVKSKRILKALHYFSHANNIERMAENNELMCDIEAAVGDLLTALEEDDPKHMEALRAAIAA